jgi:hypothetical protein
MSDAKTSTVPPPRRGQSRRKSTFDDQMESFHRGSMRADLRTPVLNDMGVGAAEIRYASTAEFTNRALRKQDVFNCTTHNDNFGNIFRC